MQVGVIAVFHPLLIRQQIPVEPSRLYILQNCLPKPVGLLIGEDIVFRGCSPGKAGSGGLHLPEPDPIPLPGLGHILRLHQLRPVEEGLKFGGIAVLPGQVLGGDGHIVIGPPHRAAVGEGIVKIQGGGVFQLHFASAFVLLPYLGGGVFLSRPQFVHLLYQSGVDVHHRPDMGRVGEMLGEVLSVVIGGGVYAVDLHRRHILGFGDPLLIAEQVGVGAAHQHQHDQSGGQNTLPPLRQHPQGLFQQRPGGEGPHQSGGGGQSHKEPWPGRAGEEVLIEYHAPGQSGADGDPPLEKGSGPAHAHHVPGPLQLPVLVGEKGDAGEEGKAHQTVADGPHIIVKGKDAVLAAP